MKKNNTTFADYLRNALRRLNTKPLYLTALALLGLSTLGIAQTVPAYVPTDGLVGWWPFNGNSNDESGNGNNGTTGSGVTLTTDRFFSSNAAYDFNGSGNISLTSLPTTGPQDFTISGWIKTNNTTVRKGIACWGQDNPWQSTYFFVTNTGYLNFDFAYNGGPQSSTFIADNQWHHVAVTCISGLVQLYLDGQPTATALQMNPNISGANKALGANIDNSGSNNFVGSLDDIGIWNRALTQQEITALYNGEPFNPPSTCNPLPANLQNGLVGYWPFCGNANDESGNGNNGTVNGATLTTDRFGNTNKAYSFDGVDNYIDCGTNTSLGASSTQPISISTWVLPESTTDGSIISKYYNLDAGNSNYFLNYGATNTILRIAGNGTDYIDDVNVNFGQWIHIVAVYASGGNSSKIYINGILTIQGTLSLNSNLVNTPFNIGRMSGSFPGYFKGKIDDIGIWNRALTQQLQHRHSPPVACLMAHSPVLLPAVTAPTPTYGAMAPPQQRLLT
jgi:hypothetical protein